MNKSICNNGSKIRKKILTLILAVCMVLCSTFIPGLYSKSFAASPPQPPQQFTATAGNAKVTLSWLALSGATSYKIYRSTNASTFTSYKTLTSTSYSDTSVSNGTTYYYYVTASNSGGESMPSNTASAMPKGNAPSAPTNLIVTASNAKVTLSWNASTGASCYYVKRSTTRGGPYTTLSTNTASTTYDDNTIRNGTLYYYVVTAYGSGSESSASNEASVTAVFQPPSNLSATGGLSKVTLSWGASPGVNNYNLKRSYTAGGPYSVIYYSINSTTWTDTNVYNGGKYYYVIVANNGGGESGNSNEASVTLSPLAPTGLRATAGNSMVSLSWNGSTGATYYNVKRAEASEGPYTTVKTNLTTVSYDDTSVINGTKYYYQITAANSGGESSASVEVSATPCIDPPYMLSIKPGDSNISLTWSAPANAVSYSVKRSTTAGGPYTVIAAELASKSYTDTSVINGTKYFYVLTAFDTYSESKPSSENSATPNIPPPVPTGLSAVTDTGKVTLSWNASQGATSYTVYKSLTGGTFFEAESGLTSTSYQDTSVTDGRTQYYYVVSTYNGSESNPSNIVSVTMKPSAPSSLSASAGGWSVNLNWYASEGATSYSVKRSTSVGGPYTTIKSGLTSQSYTDDTVDMITPYYYVVTATNAGGESGFSNSASATPINVKPNAPANLTATAGDKKASLIWNRTPGAAFYTVYRAANSSGPYTTLASNIPLTSYEDAAVSFGGKYYYIVSASNTLGESAPSNMASAAIVPLIPTNLSASSTNGKISLSWNAPAGANTYNIKKSITTGGPYTTVKNNLSANYYEDTTVTNGTSYYYVVTASNSAGESGASNEASAILNVPEAPSGLTAAAGDLKVGLSWNASSDANSYSVKRSESAGGPYIPLITGLTEISYEDITVNNGTKYYYVVTALNDCGESPSSNEVSVTPLVSAPTDLTAVVSEGMTSLSWNAVSGATSYSVKKSTTAGGPYIETIASGLTSTSFEDYEVTNGMTYYYIIIASGANCESLPSNEASAIFNFPAPQPPDALTATAGDGFVNLTWTESPNILYCVYRSTTAGGPYTDTVSTWFNGSSFMDNTVTNGIKYYYIVGAANFTGLSGPSLEVSAIPNPPAPSIPANLTATAGCNSMVLSWDASTSSLTPTYTIKRSVTSGGPYTIVSTGRISTTFTTVGLDNDVTYYYTVTASNSGVESEPTQEVSVTPTFPATPSTLFDLKATVEDGKAMLSWNNIPNGIMYVVNRATAPGGPYNHIVTLIGSLSFEDTGLTSGNTYYYKITAIYPNYIDAEVSYEVAVTL